MPIETTIHRLSPRRGDIVTVYHYACDECAWRGASRDTKREAITDAVAHAETHTKAKSKFPFQATINGVVVTVWPDWIEWPDDWELTRQIAPATVKKKHPTERKL